MFVWQYGQTLGVGCFTLPYVSSPVAFDGGELVCYSCHVYGHFHVSLDLKKNTKTEYSKPGLETKAVFLISEHFQINLCL